MGEGPAVCWSSLFHTGGDFLSNSSLSDPRLQADFARDLLEAAPDAIVTVDGDGAIVFVNAQTEVLFGYSREELMGGELETLIPGRFREDHVGHRRVFARELRVRPMGAELDLWAQTKDGREIPVEISLSPHQSANGVLISAAIRDVTRRRQMETELLAARHAAEKANEAKTRFLAAASHDLRQPLQAALLYANVLKRQHDGHKAGETATKLERSLEALQSLLNRLLDVSRLDAQAITPETMSFSVRLMLERLADELAPVAEEKGIEFRLHRDDSWVRSDPQLLERLLRNLLSNAIRYTQTGGVLVGCRHRGRELKIQVWDTGVGIPQEDQARIFDEFFQVDNPARRRQSGLGLGLAIVQRLSELLEHPVAFRSTLGRGSVFEVTVPLVGRGRPSISRSSVIAVEPTVSRRLLVVDDDLEVLDSLCAVLEANGHDVAAAADRTEALQRAEGERGIDAILCDYRLGADSNGIDLIEEIRARVGNDVPAVLLTGDSSRPLIEEARRRGLRLLFKPIQATDLEEALRESLGDDEPA